MYKRIFLTLFSGLTLWASAVAQTDVSRFLGRWYSEGSSVRIEFSLDTGGNLALKGWDPDADMKISRLTVTEEGVVKTKEYYGPTRATTFNEYVLEVDGRIKNIITDKKDRSKSTIYYTREGEKN